MTRIVITSSRKKTTPKAPVILLLATIAILAIVVVFQLGGKEKENAALVQLSTAPIQEKGEGVVQSYIDNRKIVDKPSNAQTEKKTNFEIHAPPIISESGNDEAQSATNITVEVSSNLLAKAHRVGISRKKYFDNPVENQLEGLSIAGRRFGTTPSLSKMSDKEVLQILKRPIEIFDDDDDETVMTKERTAALKNEALKFIENGGTFNEFVREMTRLSNSEADLVRDVRLEMMRIFKEEGGIATEEYLKQANKVLLENGIKEIPVPSGIRARAEDERASLQE